MTQLRHFSANSGELLTKKTILRQEKPCKHSRSNFWGLFRKEQYIKLKGREAALDKKAQGKAPIGGVCWS